MRALPRIAPVAALVLAAGLPGCSVGHPPIVAPSLQAQADAAMERATARLVALGAYRVQRPDGRQVVVIGSVMGGAPAPAAIAPPPSPVIAAAAPLGMHGASPAANPGTGVSSPAASASPTATGVAVAQVTPTSPLPARVAAAARPATDEVPGDMAVTDARHALASAIEDWRRAWETGQADRYLAFYAPQFHGDEADRATWERQRRARLASKGIHVQLAQLQTQLQGRDAQVQFVQHYASARHRDVGDKRMRWALHDGQWRIVEEHWAAR